MEHLGKGIRHSLGTSAIKILSSQYDMPVTYMNSKTSNLTKSGQINPVKISILECMKITLLVELQRHFLLSLES